MSSPGRLARPTGNMAQMAPDHDHSFGQDRVRPGERRTFVVIALTAATMVVEIAAGMLFGSMALLADGLHMASHAVALSVSAFAYVYARRHARDRRYSFGTGKVNTLAGFTGAVLLAVFAIMMAAESVGRLISPVAIVFDQAILVAVLGLLVNGASVVVLGADDEDEHDHEHADHPRVDGQSGRHHHDHNLKSAYLHVLADALTSVLAIVALLAGKFLGFVWMDPLMGIVGAVLVARWSYGLLMSSGQTLLDRQAPEALTREVTACIEADGDSRVLDLHVWSIGPGIYSVVLTVLAREPATADEYRARLPTHAGLMHVSIEIVRME